MLLAANWKMNLTFTEAKALADEFAKMADDAKSDVIVFPPAIYSHIMQQASLNGALEWGGQSSHPKASGAHTGDVSAAMFASMGASWMLAGHSERRQNHGETDEFIAQQLHSALKEGLRPILCVGETDTQRQAGQAVTIVCGQIKAALAELPAEHNIIIAYEPVWAIGTGLVAKPDDIIDMHHAIFTFMKDELKTPYDPQILYGGSVNADNARDILHLPHVGGALVGGASLKSETFQAIIDAA